MRQWFSRYSLHGIIALSLILLLAGWLSARFLLQELGPLAIHWNDTQGITRIGTIGDIDAIGISGMLIVVTNGVLGLLFASRNKSLAKAAVFTGVIIAGLLFALFMAMIAVNS